MKRIALILATNILILGFGIFAVNFLAVGVDKFARALDEMTRKHGRASLPNYDQHDWADVHFEEFDRLDIRYHAFVGWRRPPFAGETINIDQNGLRATRASEPARSSRSIAFFGGSTMWGTGVDDENTIPSLFVKKHPNFSAYNLGETAYTARQSLNFLLNMYAEGVNPEIVIFYDGVNDVAHKCRREVGPLAHAREAKIRETLQIYAYPVSFWSLVHPFMVYLEHAFPGDDSDSSQYDCARDAKEAEAVARTMLSDWAAAKYVVEGHRGAFIAILQPVAYVGAPNTQHISKRLEASLGKQFGVVYPIIRRMLNEEFELLSDNFVDLRYAFDGEEMIYVDFAHVSPNGNEIIARRIGEVLATRGLTGVDADKAAAVR